MGRVRTRRTRRVSKSDAVYFELHSDLSTPKRLSTLESEPFLYSSTNVKGFVLVEGTPVLHSLIHFNT